MDIIYSIICIILGYGFGCFSTAYLVGRLNSIDIRKEGSGNLGSTNALRTLGIKAGLLTFAGDILKTALPILLIRFLILKGTGDYAVLMALCVGLGVTLGHNFPFWLNFKGGKGIAVTASVTLCVAQWQLVAVGLLLFIAVVAITRYVSVGSLITAFYLAVNTILFYQESKYFWAMLLISFLFIVLAFVRHKENIKRLFNGTESKIGSKKEKNL